MADIVLIQKDVVDAKTLTIEKLMELASAGTVDPTPYLYITTLYTAAVSINYIACTSSICKFSTNNTIFDAGTDGRGFPEQSSNSAAQLKISRSNRWRVGGAVQKWCALPSRVTEGSRLLE